ncbi:MAG: hypothetical protein QGG40_09720, partial [Myxococcota bacterium]|nr:hypothetical protein [Myxococcota bacterium]
MQDLLPDRVIRLLSFHGSVRVVVGSGRNTIAGTAHVAPFEDCVYLFLEPDSHLNLALSHSCAVHVEARQEEGEYVLKIKGRGHCGAVVSRHERRSELQPWLPENAPHGLLVVPVVPEHIELVQQHDGQTNCYMGQTPAGVARPSSLTRWLRACLGGGALPFALLSMLGPWLWLLGQGDTFPRRGLALFSAVMAALSMLAGVRMLVLVWAFD